MGRLIYGHTDYELHFEDRLLAHLQVVIGAKLRRKEGFFLSWRDDAAAGGGRGAVWLSSAVPVEFSYDSTERIELNRAWLERLSESANSTSGLVVTDEPAAESAPSAN